MDFIEDIRIREEGAKTRFRAQIDRPAAVFHARKIRRICIAEFSPAEGDKTWELLLFRGICIHNYQSLAKVGLAKPSQQRKTFTRLYCTSATKTSNGLIVNP